MNFSIPLYTKGGFSQGFMSCGYEILWTYRKGLLLAREVPLLD
jgi:hypothetical protein